MSAGCISDKIDFLKVTHLNASKIAHRRSFQVGYEAANVRLRGWVDSKEYENVGLPLNSKAIDSVTRS